MIIPIRCFSCGKPIAHLWEDYVDRVSKGEDKKAVLDALGIPRYCCRAMFIGHIEMLDDIGHFKKF